MPELVRTLKDKDKVVFHCALSQQRGPSSALRYLRERKRLLDNDTERGVEESGSESVAAKQTVYVLKGGFVQWHEAYVMLCMTSRTCR
jgi:rhodanese-related sulfurtransferase